MINETKCYYVNDNVLKRSKSIEISWDFFIRRAQKVESRIDPSKVKLDAPPTFFPNEYSSHLSLHDDSRPWDDDSLRNFIHVREYGNAALLVSLIRLIEENCTGCPRHWSVASVRRVEICEKNIAMKRMGQRNALERKEML